jgi:hypothetical protein
MKHATHGAGALILKHASASRPSGQRKDDDYDVLADGIVIGGIFKSIPRHRPQERHSSPTVQPPSIPSRHVRFAPIASRSCAPQLRARRACVDGSELARTYRARGRLTARALERLPTQPWGVLREALLNLKKALLQYRFWRRPPKGTSLSLRLSSAAGNPLANAVSERESNDQNDCNFRHW